MTLTKTVKWYASKKLWLAVVAAAGLAIGFLGYGDIAQEFCSSLTNPSPSVALELLAQ